MTEETRQLTRRGLYDLVWKTPVDTLSKEMGLSGRGLAKLCDRHSIPVPPRGYWAQKAAGKKVKRPPLLELDGTNKPEIILNLSVSDKAGNSGSTDGNDGPNPYKEFFEKQLGELGAIEPRKQLRKPHPIIAGWLKEEEAVCQRARNSIYGGGYFVAKHATSLGRRRLRILDVILRELERRGCTIEIDNRREENLSFRLGHDRVEFTVSERIRQIRRRLTDEEKAERSYSSQEWTQTREPSGNLILKMSTYGPDGIPKSWEDETDRPLEAQISQMLAGLLTTLAYVRAKREAQEEVDRKRRAREDEARKLEAERQAYGNGKRRGRSPGKFGNM